MNGTIRRKRPEGRFLLLLHALILLHGFRGDSGRGFRAIANLRVGGGRADGAPCFAGRQAVAKNKAKKHC